MSATIFHLVHSPEVLNKLTEEIRSSFDDETEICMGTQLNSCTFLRACINESLHVPTRPVLAGDVDVDGHQFPEGVIIGTLIYTIHHDARYYPRPFKFDPGRWLETEDGEDAATKQASINVAQAAFCPFSIGPRKCVAKDMAWVELSLIIARTLFKYDMQLPADHAITEPNCCSPVENEAGKSPEYQLKA
ncbi:hypothetical protein N7457_008863 [Penicillium paradoxum]|uniref:uncharacterized protein n=1 Tax=Penicillium paradoxum TaxID=176176 RepID=UPI002549AC23|nr:uncharacterized protein N7457_008863 [Penicillium paradoxum]KAJ5773967.1 hypothetical protein N7457_008863 [Penicillium paradoxum]